VNNADQKTEAEIDACPVRCQQCGAPATRWWPGGDDGLNVKTCDSHEAPGRVTPLPLRRGTTQAQYRMIQGAVCASAPDGSPVPHRWRGRRAGGAPDDAGSYEWVVFCEACGRERDD
jgi:hypothetical protein